MRRRFLTVLVLAVIQLLAAVGSDAQTGGKKAIGQKMEIFSVNKQVVNSCASLDLIGRDEFWKEKLNTLLESRGKVLSVEDRTQFRRRYRITVAGDDGAVSLVYYIYTDNEDYKKLLQPGTVFGFRGQFVMFTPLNSKRSLYLLDVILEDGAAVIE